MSGFVVGIGDVRSNEMARMLERIRHRGPDRSGILATPRGCLAQNYLRADLGSTQMPISVPVIHPSGTQTAIGYDGQIGNWRELASQCGVANGAVRDERLLLRLYRNNGTKMLHWLDDAIFAFVILDGKDFLAARDLLGIKTLFYGRRNGRLYLASELKCLKPVTEEIFEFPPGHYMDASGNLKPFAELPPEAPECCETDSVTAAAEIRRIIGESFDSRVDFSFETGSLLSGGIDSSVIAALAAKALKARCGPDTRLQTFAFGVGESEDIVNARAVARHIGTEHHEKIVELDQMLEVLPTVVYHLESFDPSLVRSAVSNFMISRYARQRGIEVLLSGEGGDEVFCGYAHLKRLPPEKLYENQIACLKFLHNNASLRLDRMNQCNGVRVITPLISGRLLGYALSLAPELKHRSDGEEIMEKWIFRKAFETDLPPEVTWRTKQEFSQGSGSAGVLPAHFEAAISDAEFKRATAAAPFLRNKEELYYYGIFTENFGTDHAVKTVGQWRSL
jgi:asparagine synthase (glutamine-hydrolysing)